MQVKPGKATPFIYSHDYAKGVTDRLDLTFCLSSQNYEDFFCCRGVLRGGGGRKRYQSRLNCTDCMSRWVNSAIFTHSPFHFRVLTSFSEPAPPVCNQQKTQTEISSVTGNSVCTEQLGTMENGRYFKETLKWGDEQKNTGKTVLSRHQALICRRGDWGMD